MTKQTHPNSKIDSYILNTLCGSGDPSLEYISSESREDVVFDEKELTCNYTMRAPKSKIDIIVTVSEPLYFCNVTFSKTSTNYFSLKGLLKAVIGSKEIEDIFEEFIDGKVEAEEYTLKYLKVFKQLTETPKIQKIITGESWPSVPTDEELEDENEA